MKAPMRLRDNPFGVPAIALGLFAVVIGFIDDDPVTVPPLTYMMTAAAAGAWGAAFGYGIAKIDR